MFRQCCHYKNLTVYATYNAVENKVILVTFDTAVGKNDVIQTGIYHFDSKPFIVKAWSPGMDFSKEELHTVPIWIKFPGMDFKYWSPNGLGKLGSLVGNLS